MAEETTNYIKTDYVDVTDTETGLIVLSIDMTRGVNEGAKQFAAWWNDGILLRSADPKAPALTADEVLIMARRGGMGEYNDLAGYDFATRYVDQSTGQTVYPEPHYSQTGGYVMQVAGAKGYERKGEDVTRMVEILHGMCSHMVYAEPRKQQAQRRDIVADFADSQAERYQAGLDRVRALNAKQELRDEILAIRDTPTRHKLMAEYPELFDANAAADMAEGIRMQTYDADVAAWLAERTPESDAETGHGYDTTGSVMYVTSQYTED